MLFWLRRSGDLTLLSDPRHKEDLYQEISSFFAKQDVEHPDSDYSKLEEEEMRELNNSFKRMLRAFKKKQGLFREGLYDDVHPIHEGEEVDLIANIPKTGARADMIERAVFHIGFYCDTALKEHPLGSEVCKEILVLTVLGNSVDEINNIVFAGEKNKEELKTTIVTLLQDLRKEFKSKTDIDLKEYFLDPKGDGVLSFVEKKPDSRLESTRVTLDLNGLTKEEKKEKIREALGFNNDPEYARRNRTLVWRLLKRAEENNNVLVFNPTYRQEQRGRRGIEREKNDLN